MKRLVFCFDGTWNQLSADCPTNVVLLAESVVPTTKEGTAQIVYYDEGVGTGKLDRLRGGMFGVGLETNLREAYRFLIFNHEPGDEIFIFGFSRGAFTARSFAGFLRHAGILDVDSARRIDEALALYVSALKKDGDDHPAALAFRAQNSSRVCVSQYDEDWRCESWPGYAPGSARPLNVKYLGVWDTVGALGLPKPVPFSGWLNRKLGFHDVRLTSKVGAARHALAIDERRRLFRPTIWNNVNELNSDRDHSPFDIEAPFQQRWFPGVHGAVGGGGPIRGLSDSAFSWILAGARRQNLQINVGASSRVYKVAPDPLAPLQNEPARPWHDRGAIGALKHAALDSDRDGPGHLNDVSAFARRRWMTPAAALPEQRAYRPKTLGAVAAALDAFATSLAPPPAPTARDLETKSAKIHVVAHGDTLPKIAKTLFGTTGAELAADYRRLFEANEDLIDDPREIHIGWHLRLPQ